MRQIDIAVRHLTPAPEAGSSSATMSNAAPISARTAITEPTGRPRGRTGSVPVQVPNERHFIVWCATTPWRSNASRAPTPIAKATLYTRACASLAYRRRTIRRDSARVSRTRSWGAGIATGSSIGAAQSVRTIRSTYRTTRRPRSMPVSRCRSAPDGLGHGQSTTSAAEIDWPLSSLNRVVGCSEPGFGGRMGSRGRQAPSPTSLAGAFAERQLSGRVRGKLNDCDGRQADAAAAGTRLQAPYGPASTAGDARLLSAVKSGSDCGNGLSDATRPLSPSTLHRSRTASFSVQKSGPDSRSRPVVGRDAAQSGR